MIYLACNESINMEKDKEMVKYRYTISEDTFTKILKNNTFKSIIQFQSLARHLSRLTGKRIIASREHIDLEHNDIVLLANYPYKAYKQDGLIDYRKKRLTYHVIRFERQTAGDLLISKALVDKLKGE